MKRVMLCVLYVPNAAGNRQSSRRLSSLKVIVTQIISFSYEWRREMGGSVCPKLVNRKV